MIKEQIIKTIKEQFSDRLFYTVGASWTAKPLDVEVEKHDNCLDISFIARLRKDKNDLYKTERLYGAEAEIYFNQLQMPFVGGLKQFYYELNTKVFMMTYHFQIQGPLTRDNLLKILSVIY